MEFAYFDNAATTSIRREVLEVMIDAMTNLYGNPSSTHGKGREVRSEVELTRKMISKQLNVSASEIIFTSGGTESNNMIISGAIEDLGVKTIITSPIEHSSVLMPCKHFEKKGNIVLKYVRILPNGSICLNHLEELLAESSGAVLVSLMHVNNEIGNITDVKAVSKLCKAKNAFYHCDAVQSIGHFEWDLQDVNLDFLSASGHKFHGPKGAGFAFIRKHSLCSPLIWGGNQERSLRSGTEATHNIIGLGKAFQFAYQSLNEERAKVLTLKTYFVQQLKKNFSNVVFSGLSDSTNDSTYTLVNVCFPDVSEEDMMLLGLQLDLKGIACSKGSACQSGSSKPSHVIDAIPVDKNLKRNCFRFSFSIYNTLEEVDYFIEIAKAHIPTKISA